MREAKGSSDPFTYEQHRCPQQTDCWGLKLGKALTSICSTQLGGGGGYPAPQDCPHPDSGTPAQLGPGPSCAAPPQSPRPSRSLSTAASTTQTTDTRAHGHMHAHLCTGLLPGSRHQAQQMLLLGGCTGSRDGQLVTPGLPSPSPGRQHGAHWVGCDPRSGMVPGASPPLWPGTLPADVSHVLGDVDRPSAMSAVLAPSFPGTQPKCGPRGLSSLGLGAGGTRLPCSSRPPVGGTAMPLPNCHPQLAAGPSCSRELLPCHYCQVPTRAPQLSGAPAG